MKLTIDESIIILKKALDKIVSFDDGKSKTDFILDIVNEYKQLLLYSVVQTKPEKVCELIRQKLDDWVFGLETQAGEKLKVVDSSDFNDIITEIENELKED